MAYQRTPYLQELMDALSPRHPAQRVVFMKGSQLGASESGCNWIGYVIHHAPGPMLAVQPSVELAKRFSQQRIDPLIEESPSLREKVAPARSRDSGNTVLSKEFPGGILVLTGANSAVGLRSMPVRYLFLDEVDAYPPSADDEGDPVALAEARTRTFSWRRKVFLASTPTIKGLSRIEREYEASDQRRFFVPCPHCGETQHLKFERLRWEKGQPETAAYVCEGCEQPIAEHHKTKMLADGEWRPTATPADPLSIGFHLSSLYSPVGWLSWERIAREWEACQSSDEAKRSFINTVLGETWAETGEAPDWQRLYERREDWRIGTVPPGGLVPHRRRRRAEGPDRGLDLGLGPRPGELADRSSGALTAGRESPRRGPRSPNCSARPGRMPVAPRSGCRGSRSTPAMRRRPSTPGRGGWAVARWSRSRASTASAGRHR